MHYDLIIWPIFRFLESDFASEIYMVMVYGTLSNKGLIVTKNKIVYTLGTDTDCCLTCHNKTLHTKEVKMLNVDVKTFACGSNHVLVLMENGKIYSWGCNDHGEMGNGTIDTNTEPTQVHISQKDPEMNHVVDIACGSHHSLVLTKTGQAFVWGSNDCNQVGNTAIKTLTPGKVALDKNIVQVACGKDFSLVVTKDGEVYGWGSNSDGQLGKNDCATQYYADKIYLLQKIVKVTCGSNYVLALTDDGELYAWGGNSYGQLGIGDTTNTSVPCMVTHEMGRVFDIVALHSGHISVAVGENQCVYMWGQCGGQNILVPTLSPFLTVHEVLAIYASPNIMHKPLILEEYTPVYSSVHESIENAFNDKSTSDLTIQVENKPVYVHKAILKIRCTYFKNMFQHDWSENKQSVIEHNEFSYNVYKAFLKYLYSGRVDLPLEEACELLKLANAYCEHELTRYCIRLIKKSVSVANVLFLYSFAINNNAKELEEFCFKFALNNMTELANEFLLVDENTVKTFICRAAKAGAFGS